MRVTTKRFAFGTRAERLRLVLLVLAVFLCGWSLVGHATVYGSGSMGRTTWDYERMMNQVVRALPSSGTGGGLVVGGDGVARIGYAGKRIGTIAMTESAVIGLGDIAAIAARSVNPAMIALMVGTLAVEALQRCSSSASGWCKRAPANLSESDTGFNGFGWGYSYSTVATGGGFASGIAPSPGAACSAVGASDAFLAGQKAKLAGIRPVGNGTSYECHFTNDGGENFYSGVSQVSSCVSGYVLSGAQCVVDPAAPANWLPVLYPDVAAAWNRQMAANPQQLPDYWHAMTPDEQAQAAAKAQTQPAAINGSDTVSDPSAQTGTQTQPKADGTLETCTTNTAVTVRARSNTGSTAGSSPLNYQTTTTNTRTCPTLGTTTNTSNQDSGDTGTQTGGGPASAVTANPLPASSPVPCGLSTGGSSPCKIDETGTSAYSEPTVAKSKMDDADNRLKSQVDSIGQAKLDQFGIGDVVKPLQGACSPFSYAVPKGAGVESVDVDLCPTLDLGRDGATWVWLIVSALVSILLVRDAINGA